MILTSAPPSAQVLGAANRHPVAFGEQAGDADHDAIEAAG